MQAQHQITPQTRGEQIRQIIGNVILAHTHCTLIGYPDRWKATDTAIWVGARLPAASKPPKGPWITGADDSGEARHKANQLLCM